MQKMQDSEPARSVLTEEERRECRMSCIKRAVSFFQNRAHSDSRILSRRKNLSSHLGADETVMHDELQMINLQALPLDKGWKFDWSVPGDWTRYIFEGSIFKIVHFNRVKLNKGIGPTY